VTWFVAKCQQKITNYFVYGLPQLFFSTLNHSFRGVVKGVTLLLQILAKYGNGCGRGGGGGCELSYTWSCA
jgi:hypothetical protein